MLLRDIAGDTASKAANKVNPSEDELANIDRPAEDNVWHETPDLSKDNLKSQVQSRVPIGRKDAEKAAGDASQAAHPEGSRDPADAGLAAAADQQQGTASTDPRSGAKAGAQNLKETASSNIDDDKKDKAREYRERTQNYFKGKMPKERREQLVWRLKKMVVEIQGHQDCRFRGGELLTFSLTATDTFYRRASHRHHSSPGRAVRRSRQERGPTRPIIC